MRLPLDACMDGRTAAYLSANHDVVSVAQWHAQATDIQVLAFAAAERRILVTLDQDFGRLIVLEQRAHCGLLRLVGFQGCEEGAACERALELFGPALLSGGLVVYEPDRSRLRAGQPPPGGDVL